MLEFFRINDPFRLLIVFILLLGIRLPLIFSGEYGTLADVHAVTIAERLASGELMYKDIWDSLPPLTAWTYWLLYLLVGKSIIAFQLVSLLLVFIQAYVFNKFLLKNDLYNEKNYLPAFLYVVVCSIGPDCLSLSGVILGLTPLMFAIRAIFQLATDQDEQSVFLIGFYTSLAGLFYLPYIFYLLFALGGFFFFRTLSIKYIALISYGFIFPFALVFISYFLVNAHVEFLKHYLFYGFDFQSFSSPNPFSLFLISSIAGCISIIAVVFVFLKRGFLNYQVSCQRLMAMWLGISTLLLFLVPSVETRHLLYFAPAIVFFVVHLFLSIKARFLAEMTLNAFVFSIIGLLFNLYFSYTTQFDIRKDEFFCQEQNLVQQKRVLVIGEDLSYYKNNTAATPYFNWSISESEFEKLDTYDGLLDIYDNFSRDLPYAIVDQKQIMPRLFAKLPALADKYYQTDKQSNYYFLKQ